MSFIDTWTTNSWLCRLHSSCCCLLLISEFLWRSSNICSETQRLAAVWCLQSRFLWSGHSRSTSSFCLRSSLSVTETPDQSPKWIFGFLSHDVSSACLISKREKCVSGLIWSSRRDAEVQCCVYWSGLWWSGSRVWSEINNSRWRDVFSWLMFITEVHHWSDVLIRHWSSWCVFVYWLIRKREQSQVMTSQWEQLMIRSIIILRIRSDPLRCFRRVDVVLDVELLNSAWRWNNWMF